MIPSKSEILLHQTSGGFWRDTNYNNFVKLNVVDGELRLHYISYSDKYLTEKDKAYNAWKELNYVPVDTNKKEVPKPVTCNVPKKDGTYFRQVKKRRGSGRIFTGYTVDDNTVFYKKENLLRLAKDPDKSAIKNHEKNGGKWLLVLYADYSNVPLLEQENLKIVDDKIMVDIHYTGEQNWVDIDTYGYKGYKLVPIDKDFNIVEWPISDKEYQFKKDCPKRSQIKEHIKNGGKWKLRRANGSMPTVKICLTGASVSLYDENALFVGVIDQFSTDEFCPVDSNDNPIAWEAITPKRKVKKEASDLRKVLNDFRTVGPLQPESVITSDTDKPAAHKNSTNNIKELSTTEKIAVKVASKQVIKYGHKFLVDKLSEAFKGREKINAINTITKVLSTDVGACLTGLFAGKLAEKVIENVGVSNNKATALAEEIQLEGAAQLGSMCVDMVTDFGGELVTQVKTVISQTESHVPSDHEVPLST
jgi:hypothetical protein